MLTVNLLSIVFNISTPMRHADLGMECTQTCTKITKLVLIHPFFILLQVCVCTQLFWNKNIFLHLTEVCFFILNLQTPEKQHCFVLHSVYFVKSLFIITQVRNNSVLLQYGSLDSRVHFCSRGGFHSQFHTLQYTGPCL